MSYLIRLPYLAWHLIWFLAQAGLFREGIESIETFHWYSSTKRWKTNGLLFVWSQTFLNKEMVMFYFVSKLVVVSRTLIGSRFCIQVFVNLKTQIETVCDLDFREAMLLWSFQKWWEIFLYDIHATVSCVRCPKAREPDSLGMWIKNAMHSGNSLPIVMKYNANQIAGFQN